MKKPPRQKKSKIWDRPRFRICAYLFYNTQADTEKIAKETGVPRYLVRNHMHQMHRELQVRVVSPGHAGSGPKMKPAVWRISA